MSTGVDRNSLTRWACNSTIPPLPCTERTEDKMLISNGIIEQLSGEAIRDFCSSRDLFYACLAADFIAAEVVVPTAGTFALNSLGAWLACRECTDLIEGESSEELLELTRDIHMGCVAWERTGGAGALVTPQS
jgi:hypothetical protein